MKIIIDEDKREVMLYLTRSDLDSVALTALFRWYKIKPEMDDIDEELHPLIADMRKYGYRTFNCCSGHHRVAGNIMFLPPKKRIFKAARWEPNEPIPQSISQLRGVLPMKCIRLRGNGDGVEKWLEIKASIEIKHS